MASVSGLNRPALFAAALFVGVQVLASLACASTVANWRHEEGTVGSIVPDGANTVLDSSGNGNHMQTFRSAFAPFTAATYSSIVPALPLRSGQANTKSLDFGPMPTIGMEDGGDPDNNNNALNDDNYTTPDKPGNNPVFGALTVELAFNMHAVGGFQALMGHDGRPLGDAPGEDNNPVPPLKIMVRGDDFPPPGSGIPNQLFVEWVDGDGTLNTDDHFLAGGETIQPDHWYQVAFTLTASTAELWVSEDSGPYVLKDSSTGDYIGADGRVLVSEPLGWSVGRGMYNNNPADWANAIIDEVKISDTALTASEFEFLAPTPSNADFDGNGMVDGRDFLIWQRSQGGAGDHSVGDANGDNTVTGDDLAIWKSQFGSSAVTAVPEPVSWMLAAAGLIACLRVRKRKLGK
jgi:hypothetical protein